MSKWEKNHISKNEPMSYEQKMFLIKLGFNVRDLETGRFSKRDAFCLIDQAVKEKAELKKLEKMENVGKDEKLPQSTTETKEERWFKGDNEENW